MKTTIKYFGSEIQLTSDHKGKTEIWNQTKQLHIVYVKTKGSLVWFDYHCNDAELSEDELVWAFSCFLGDCIAYDETRTIDEFCKMFGGDWESSAQAYDGCYREWKSFNDTLAKDGYDLYELNNYINDKYHF